MTSKTATTAEAQRLHNSQALNATFGDVQATCQNIINIESGIKSETAGLKDVSTTLFNQVRKISKVTELKAPDIFNHLAFLLDFDHLADKETGAPDLSGIKKKTGNGAWPKGKLSTYRSYIKKYEEVEGPIHKAPDMAAVRAVVNPKKSDNPLMQEIRAYQSKDNKDFTDAQREAVDAKLHRAVIDILAAERKAVQALKKAQEDKEAAEIAATRKAAKKEAAAKAKVKKAEKAAEKKLEASNVQSKPVKKQEAPAKSNGPDLGLLAKIAQGVGGKAQPNA